MRGHAPDYGADASTVVVAGSSAGAHLAAMAALTAEHRRAPARLRRRRHPGQRRDLPVRHLRQPDLDRPRGRRTVGPDRARPQRGSADARRARHAATRSSRSSGARTFVERFRTAAPGTPAGLPRTARRPAHASTCTTRSASMPSSMRLPRSPRGSSRTARVGGRITRSVGSPRLGPSRAPTEAGTDAMPDYLDAAVEPRVAGPLLHGE